MSNSNLRHLVFSVFLFTLMQTSAGADTNPLTEYRWKNRLLVIFAENDSDPDVLATREALDASVCELADRDMVIGWILKRGQSRMGATGIDARTSVALRSRLGIRSDDFSAVLIGKDGGVKARYDKAPEPKDVFSLIDGMPMRRAEQRTRGSPCDDG